MQGNVVESICRKIARSDGFIAASYPGEQTHA